jgi:hypothetical protein
MVSGELVSIAAAVAWGGLWMNLVVIPFYGKGERLHQDYKEKGAIDAALAGIESRRLIPALASLFEHARDAQADKRQKIEMDVLLQSLQSVDFLPDLEEVEQALREKRNVEDSYRQLRLIARQLWVIGLGNVLATLLLALSCLTWLPTSMWTTLTQIVLGAAWVATLAWTVRKLFRFHGQMNDFTTYLGQYTGGRE